MPDEFTIVIKVEADGEVTPAPAAEPAQADTEEPEQ